jgi:hypothetical protein
MNRQIIPLSKRPGDIAIVAFFLINILFITYIVDLEQLVIADPVHFTYPLWPPPIAVDVIHWWGRTFDPVLLARPAWWKVTIWIDALFFGPFYIVAIYAYSPRERMDSHSQYYVCLGITDHCAGDTWRGDSRYTCYTTFSHRIARQSALAALSHLHYLSYVALS